MSMYELLENAKFGIEDNCILINKQFYDKLFDFCQVKPWRKIMMHFKRDIRKNKRKKFKSKPFCVPDDPGSSTMKFTAQILIDSSEPIPCTSRDDPLQNLNFSGNLNGGSNDEEENGNGEIDKVESNDNKTDRSNNEEIDQTESTENETKRRRLN